MTEFNPQLLTMSSLYEAARFVVAFQALVDEDEDGIAGTKTWAALHKLIPGKPHRDLSERESFMIEAAIGHGFEWVNGDATVYVATQEQIVSLMQSYRSSDELAFTDMKIGDFIALKTAEAMERIAAATHDASDPAQVDEAIKNEIMTVAQDAALQAIMDKVALIDNLAVSVHSMNVKAGWWNNIKTGEDLHGVRNVGELLALKHSEVSEANDADEDMMPALLDLQIAVTYAIAEQNDRDRRMLELHSALSRAMEYYRKGNKADDKLTHRPGFRVELIDVIIRALDTLASDRRGQRDHPAGTLFMEKVEFNRIRPDHQKAARLEDEGKTF